MALDNFRKINITLNKANQHILEPQITKVGDANGRELVVQIIDGGVIKDQTGITLKLNWQHANGNQGSEIFGALDAKQGVFSVYYPENMLFRGTVTASISINESGKITNSLNFQIAVKGDVFDGSAVEVDGVLFTLKDLKNQLDERDENLTILENRQNTVENQFDLLQQEITDKDVVSAPEIIEARNGEDTLSARLDKEQQEVNAQLAQKVDKISNSITKKSVKNGGQLLKLHNALTNPFHQFLGINFTGDSITWGLGASGNNPDYNIGRDGTLSDRRDYFNSLSFVNLFKRHIGENYMGGATPVLSKLTNSPSGEAIATYRKTIDIYPGRPEVKQTVIGNAAIQEVADNGALLGKTFRLRKGYGKEGNAQISFVFTGEKFEVLFSSVSNLADYEVIVNGNSLGTFSTRSGVDGRTDGYSRTRVHEFEYVREKEVIVKIVPIPDFPDVTQSVYLEAIRIEKTVRIKNQGIIGTTATNYLAKAMTGNQWGDGVAVDKKDEFNFCQLGTNDRALTNKENLQGNKFASDLNLLVNDLYTYGNVILMCANPVKDEIYSFTMQDVRNIISSLAKTKNLDFIDNYTIFGSINTDLFAPDGTHLNDFGNQKVFENITEALGS